MVLSILMFEEPDTVSVVAFDVIVPSILLFTIVTDSHESEYVADVP